MSKVKHAPGPWSYHSASADACIDAIERHGQDMNAVYAFNNDGEVGTVCFLSDTMIGEANARLIAAAPDLLEALRDVTRGGWGSDGDRAASMRAARAAITKAIGA